MQIEIVSRTANVGIDNRKTVGDRVRFLLDRFQQRIQRIEVRLVDENGPKGGVDRRCVARARLDDGTQVIAEAKATLVPIAIDRALRRIARRIVSLQRRREAMRRIRHGLAPGMA
jgi:ribosome-associated translation inhibitor RaiA